LTATQTTAGYEVLRGAVPQEAVDRALRHIHRDVATRGLPQEWLAEWLWNAHWFPHLRWDDEIRSLVDHLPAAHRDGELCDPQIVGQMPDDPDAAVELESHVDQLPEWAGERPYTRILGVALTRNGPENGGLTVWPLDGSPQQEIALEPGDVLVMDPRLPHASGVNRTGSIRYCVYFRFLAQ
jgi:Phytanoyl-CoA dioxygenase (PhyH)